MTIFSKAWLAAALTIGGVLSSTASPAQSKPEGAVQQLFQAINQERAANGLPPLKWDESLATAARQHAEAMAAQKSVSHVLPGEPSLPSRAVRAGAASVGSRKMSPRDRMPRTSANSGCTLPITAPICSTPTWTQWAREPPSAMEWCSRSRTFPKQSTDAHPRTSYVTRISVHSPGKGWPPATRRLGGQSEIS